MKIKKIKISVLIPCHNEEKSIKKCVDSCLDQTRKADEIIVVNDSSTDNSLKILKRFGKKIKVIQTLSKASSKSHVQERGLRFLKGDIFITTDADTILDNKFVEIVAQNFTDPKTVAVAGYVKSLKHNWLTACRELNYIIGQKFDKLAQSYLDALFVIPGCAGAFRTKIFKENIFFEHDTITEDLDFTFKLHEEGLKIKYEKKAIVYTQDPDNLKSYIKQMKRWYGGGWQNLAKHYRQILNKPRSVLELCFIYGDGLLASVLIFLTPLLDVHLFVQLMKIYFPIMGGFAIYAAITEKRKDVLIYFPLQSLLTLINSWIFIQEFINEIILKRKNTVWFQPERRLIR